MIILNNIFKQLVYIFVYTLFIALSSLSFADQWLDEEIADSVEIDYDIDCDSLVQEVRSASRERMLANPGQVSVEQIYKRETLKLTDDKVECLGEAMLSDSSRIMINYGSYIDELGDRIIHYKSN